MKIHHSISIATVLLAACGEGNPTADGSVADTGADIVRSDGRTDSATDARDAAVDTSQDVRVDATTDVRIDSATDAGMDATDARTDAADIGSDSMADVGADVLDGSWDAGSRDGAVDPTRCPSGQNSVLVGYYFMGGNTIELREIDPTTAESVPFPSAASPTVLTGIESITIGGIASDISSGRVYQIASSVSAPGMPRIYATDTRTGALLGNPALSTGINVSALWVNNGGVVQSFLNVTSPVQFGQIDPGSGNFGPFPTPSVPNPIPGFGGAAVGGTAVDPALERVYQLGSTVGPTLASVIVTMNTTTGAMVSTATTGSFFNVIVPGVNRNGTILAIFPTTPLAEIRSIDPVTGASAPFPSGTAPHTLAGLAQAFLGPTTIDNNRDRIYQTGSSTADTAAHFFTIDTLTGNVITDVVMPDEHPSDLAIVCR